MVETPERSLSRAMHWLNVSYSVWYNRRHRRVGHLFQGRYGAVVVEAAAWGLKLSRYVHLNPVRMWQMGLGKDTQQASRMGVGPAPQHEEAERRVVRLREYPWSSYRAYAGLAVAPAWLNCGTVLGLIGGRAQAEQRRAYRRYVEEAARTGLPERPWEHLVGQVLLGAEEFCERIRKGLRGEAQEQPSLRALRQRPDWQQVVRAVEAVKGEQWEAFRDRHGDLARDMAMYLGRKEGGLSLKELGAKVGGLDYRTVGWAIARFGRRVAADRRLGQELERARDNIKNPET
jgi:hypothetical protein